MSTNSQTLKLSNDCDKYQVDNFSTLGSTNYDKKKLLLQLEKM